MRFRIHLSTRIASAGTLDIQIQSRDLDRRDTRHPWIDTIQAHRWLMVTVPIGYDTSIEIGRQVGVSIMLERPGDLSRHDPCQ